MPKPDPSTWKPTGHRDLVTDRAACSKCGKPSRNLFAFTNDEAVTVEVCGNCRRSYLSPVSGMDGIDWATACSWGATVVVDGTVVKIRPTMWAGMSCQPSIGKNTGPWCKTVEDLHAAIVALLVQTKVTP